MAVFGENLSISMCQGFLNLKEMNLLFRIFYLFNIVITITFLSILFAVELMISNCVATSSIRPKQQHYSPLFLSASFQSSYYWPGSPCGTQSRLNSRNFA